MGKPESPSAAYSALEARLLALRTEEDAILDEMDGLWRRMSEEERTAASGRPPAPSKTQPAEDDAVAIAVARQRVLGPNAKTPAG